VAAAWPPVSVRAEQRTKSAFSARQHGREFKGLTILRFDGRDFETQA
jgi:hypothetical protein